MDNLTIWDSEASVLQKKLSAQWKEAHRMGDFKDKELQN